MQKARLARTMVQKETKYKKVEHFADLPGVSEDKKHAAAAAKASKATRVQPRREVKEKATAGNGGNNPEDEAETRTATPKTKYVPRKAALQLHTSTKVLD